MGDHEDLHVQAVGTEAPVMAGSSSDFTASITELQAVLLSTDSIDGFLRELAILAARQLGEGLSCGITMQPDGRPLTVASSDANAAQVDELQYGLDHGPCLTALRDGERIRIDDLVGDQRWHTARRRRPRLRAGGRGRITPGRVPGVPRRRL